MAEVKLTGTVEVRIKDRREQLGGFLQKQNGRGSSTVDKPDALQKQVWRTDDVCIEMFDHTEQRSVYRSKDTEFP